MLKTYGITFVVFFLVDILWLGLVAKNIYAQHLGHLMADKTNWLAAIIFYAVFIGGLVLFAINPALQKESLKYAIMYGAMFGFMTYFTYDMTNLATLKNWPVFITIIDVIWGTLLNALTAGITFYIINFLAR